MQLKQAVTTILLNSARPLKAREIHAVCCRTANLSSVTVKDVNSVLYSDLRGSVEQDGSYRWTMKKSGPGVARRKQESYGKERARQHIEEARRLSQLLGGTDVDVKNYFFNLPEHELNDVLDEYERKYGRAKRSYAEHALPQWRRRRKQMSGLVAERLFNLLPPRMPLSVKYDMVRTIWEAHGPRSVARFTIGPDCELEAASREIEQQLLHEVTQYEIPEPLESRFNWLSSGDVKIRQTLLNHFLDQERALLAADARNRTRMILDHFTRNGQWTGSVKQDYRIGNHRLEIIFDPHASGIQKGPPRPAMAAQGRSVESSPESSGCVVAAATIVAAGIAALLNGFFAIW